MDDSNKPVSRRTLLAGAVLVPVAALECSAQGAILSRDESQTLEAFIDRLVPKDENGPGAVECGAKIYIEQSLAGPLEAEKSAFTAGLAALDALAGNGHGGAFANLAASEKDEVLAAFEKSSGAFFNRVRQLTLEGMFGDPYYGGNRSFQGWELIRYPGPRLAVSAEEQKLRDPIKPLRASGAGHGH